jgi:serine/threonine protein phosphatase PrpC
VKALLSHAVRTIAASAGQDRAIVAYGPMQTILAIADGAGGVTGGRRAAELVVATADRLAAGPFVTPATATECLMELDVALAVQGGETTAILVAVDTSRGTLAGASVGNSRAWLADDDGIHELTEHQELRPRVGSGRAVVTAFERRLKGSWTLLAATDGLTDYATLTEIRAALDLRDADAIADQCAALPRLPSGRYPDDVAVVVLQKRDDLRVTGR